MAQVMTAGNAPAKHSNFFFSMVEKAVAAYQERKAISQLEALDDRLLADVGLSRGDLVDWHTSGKIPAR